MVSRDRAGPAGACARGAHAFRAQIELKDFVRCVSTDHSKASIADPNKGSRFEIR